MNPAQKSFGTVTPPPYADISFGGLLIWGLKAFFFVMCLMALYYMLMGAFHWITSEGAEEKITEAQKQITSSLIALVVAIGVLVIWGLVAGNMLNIVKQTADGGWMLCLPTISGNTCQKSPANPVNSSGQMYLPQPSGGSNKPF